MPRADKKVVHKYQRVLVRLEEDILSGKYKAGQKLPSEATLIRQFQTSRITVGRAIRELGNKGLIDRRVGSGTYVRAEKTTGLLFGLLIPDLGETEIFEPICQGMASARQAAAHALLWANVTTGSASKEEQAWQLCRQYISRDVSGVFFAALEHTPESEKTNHRILAALESAEIPVVLLDREVLPYPRRGKHDLIGIDNHRAGFMITEHLLGLGCRRIGFLTLPDPASTVAIRISGFREALSVYCTPSEAGFVQRLDPSQEPAVRRMVESIRPDAIICSNDRTAGILMHSLIALGYRIPADIRIAGFDDVKYARLLPVPLTTIHQPCRNIGEAAMAAMLERISRPDMPPRDILLGCTLVVRDSCGAGLGVRQEIGGIGLGGVATNDPS
jgi:DNA-binding LacI/PurR family transcriptional regulator